MRLLRPVHIAIKAAIVSSEVVEQLPAYFGALHQQSVLVVPL